MTNTEERTVLCHSTNPAFIIKGGKNRMIIHITNAFCMNGEIEASWNKRGREVGTIVHVTFSEMREVLCVNFHDSGIVQCST